MKIPTGFAQSLTEALHSGAVLLHAVDQGDIEASSCHELLTKLLDNLSEPEVKRYYQSTINRLEYGTETNRLRAHAPELLDALEPLANLELSATLLDKPDNYPLYGLNDSIITVGDVRQARAVIALSKGQKP